MSLQLDGQPAPIHRDLDFRSYVADSTGIGVYVALDRLGQHEHLKQALIHAETGGIITTLEGLLPDFVEDTVNLIIEGLQAQSAF